MPMKNPPHPGGIVKDCIEDLGLSVTDAAKVLGVTRPTLSRIINGHAAISPEMAFRLSKAFGSTPEMWLRMQTAYALAQVRNYADEIQVERYQPSAVQLTMER
jgi:antitoxin HigA-1